MARFIFWTFIFIALLSIGSGISVTGFALYQNRTIFWREEDIDPGLRIGTEEQKEILFCGEVLVSGAIVRSQAKFGDNIVGSLDKGDMVKVYEVVEGDIYIFTRSVRGYTNNIWYRIGEEEFIYSSLVQEEMDRALCLQ